MIKPADDDIVKTRKSAEQIGSLRKLVQLAANSALSKDVEPVESLARIGEQCRQIGAHAEAAKVYKRISELDPNFANATQLYDILSGAVVDDQQFQDGPVPFVQLTNFLSSEMREQLLKWAIKDLEFFEDAGVYGPDTEIVRNSNGRRGKVLDPGRIAPYKDLFWPELKSALKTQPIVERLGSPDLTFERIEFQVTNYSEGDFFGRHVDDNILRHRNRKISYVYYFRRSPGAFIGGDLLLYDHQNSSNAPTSRSFTRILPIDNSIVFFLSSSLHEVFPTFVESEDRKDGRFSINGWLLNDG